MLRLFTGRGKPSFSMPPFEHGELSLVPMSETHAPALFKIIEQNRAYLGQWQNWPDTIHTLDEMRDLIRISHSKLKSQLGYDMVILHQGIVAGKIGLVYIDQKAGFGEIGYWLGEQFQGLGLMTRATRFITGHAICVNNLPNVYIRCAAKNVRSRAIPERLGFHFAGIQPQKIWIHGEPLDDTLYIMTEKAWYKTMIYHITTKADWEAAKRNGQYSAESLETQGFIHASRLEQITRVADAFYTGQKGLILLCIDPERLQSELRNEPPDMTIPAEHYDGELFPHIYGTLNVDAVLKTVDFPPNADGTFTLPDELAADDDI
jgi:ribosomal-protein-serine acetyltransferase